MTLGWWTLSGEDLMHALHRAYEGENPEIIYAEMYANSVIEGPDNE
jgi:hypothetical protein